MDKQKKSLLCMYVEDFCGIEKESFNFCIERRYIIKEGKIGRKGSEEIKGFPKDFWGNNVSAVTLLIGENGAGKTTLMRLLVKWLCQLSAGHLPQEKGALVINVSDADNENDNDGNNNNNSDNNSNDNGNSDYEKGDKLIAFENGKPWDITINNSEEIVRIKDIEEIKKLLRDIRLAYYTDTMTDLELSNILSKDELAFLKDDSLLARLSDSMGSKYTVDSIKDCIKREDFKRQMNLFFDIFSYRKRNPQTKLEFPIRYMKLTTIKAGDQKAFKEIADGNGSLVRKAIDLWNEVFSKGVNKKLPDIAKDLLWGLFSGTIISLLRWESTLPNLKESIVTGQVSNSIRAYIRYNYYDWNVGFKRFFKNIFIDCAREFRNVYRDDRFHMVWNEQVEVDIKGFLDALKKIETGEFLSKWDPDENAQNIWEFRLGCFDEEDLKEKGNDKDKKEEQDKKDENGQLSLIQSWKELWKHYLTVAELMPECRFDWKYASSGGKNIINLYTILFNIVGKDNDRIEHLWILLDEPDNTFHPDWKRRAIYNILEVCSLFHKNFQLLISTHSPIMLSDVPKQAAILMKINENKGNDKISENRENDKINKKEENDKITREKQQIDPKSSPFGQQIYTLFNDAFFMERGIIGTFADMKIGEVYKKLCEIEEKLSKRKYDWDEEGLKDPKEKLEKCEFIIKLIEEPLLHGHLSQSYKLCKRRIEELLKSYL